MLTGLIGKNDGMGLSNVPDGAKCSVDHDARARIDNRFGEFRQKAAQVAVSALVLAAFGIVTPAFAGDWVLTQRSQTMGDQYVYVTPSAFKWVNPKMGANVITTSPSWTVTMFNDKTKAYYDTTFQEWKSQLASRSKMAPEMQANKWVKSGSGEVAGMKATKYVMQGSGVAKRLPNGKVSNNLGSVKQAECWLSDDITVPAQLSEVLSSAYGLPLTRFFPLRVTYVTGAGKAGTALDTYRSQACSLPETYFRKPQGYQLANSSAEVLMDAETKEMLRDLVTDYDDKKPAGRQQAARSAPRQTQSGQQAGGLDLSKLIESLKDGK